MFRFASFWWRKSKNVSRPASKRRCRLEVQRLEDRLTPSIYTWTGLGGDNNWSTANNWVAAIVPTPADTDIELLFPNITNTNFNTNNNLVLTINEIEFNGTTNYSISGNGMTLDDDGAADPAITVAGGSVSISVGITMDAPLTLGTTSVSAQATLSGKISGAAANSLTKTGPGTLVLSGNNDYAGQTNAQNGTVKITHANALGTAAGKTVLGVAGTSNTTLQVAISGGGTITENIELTGVSGVTGPGSVYEVSSSGGNIVQQGTITLITANRAGTIKVDGTRVLTLAGGLSSQTGNARPVFKEGTGTWIINLANADFDSNTIINQGKVQMENQDSLGDGSSAQNIKIAADAELNLNFTGGTVNANVGFALHGGTIRNPDGVGNTLAGDVTLDAADNTVAVDGGDLAMTGTISAGFSASTVLSKTGPGLLKLGGNNTYQGHTHVDGGILKITDANGLGASGANNATAVASDAALQVDTAGTVAEWISLDNGTLPAGTFGNLDVKDTVTLTGDITLDSTSTIGLSGASKTLSLNSKLTGAGGVIFNNQGTGSSNILLGNSPSSNDFLGDATIQAGLVKWDADEQIPDARTLFVGGAVAATADLNSNTETIKKLTYLGNGTVTDSGGTLALSAAATIKASGKNNSLTGVTLKLGGNTTVDVVNPGDELSIASKITGSGGTENVTKVGAGTLEFTGTADNDYNGGTFVNAGRLELNKTANTNAVPHDLTVGDGVGTDRVVVKDDEQIPDTSKVTVNNGGILEIEFATTSETIGSAAGGELNLKATSTVSGDGTLILGVNPTFSGTGSVNLSVATLDLGGVARTFNIGAGLTVRSSGELINGNLTKTGAGTLKVEGDNNTVNSINSLTVDDGLALVNGDSSAVDFFVNADGTLGGGIGDDGIIANPLRVGAVRDLTVDGGTVAPGATLNQGTLKVLGNLFFSSALKIDVDGDLDVDTGAEFHSPFDPPLTADFLEVTGTAEISDADLQVALKSLAPFIAKNNFVKILQADGGVTGGFSNQTIPNGFKFQVLADSVVLVREDLLPSSTSLTAIPTSSLTSGQQLVLNAQVTGQGANVPQGTVVFKDNGLPIGTAALGGGGTATYSIIVSAGTHTYTAQYLGSTDYEGSITIASTSVTVVVNKAASSTSLTASAATLESGESLVLSVEVNGAAASTPQGSVFFKDGGTGIGTPKMLVDGKASLTLTPGAGSHSYTAQYLGDAEFNGSTSSPAVPVTVNAAPPAPLPEAYLLDQSLGLKLDPSGMWLNWAGLGEKWLRAANLQWYFITPAGQLYKWDNASRGIGNSQLEALLDPLYHLYLDLLYNASNLDATYFPAKPSGQENVPYVLNQRLGLILKNSLFFNWGGRQEKWVYGNTVGKWFFILADGRFYQWDGSANATGTLLTTLDPLLYTQPALLYNALPNA